MVLSGARGGEESPGTHSFVRGEPERSCERFVVRRAVVGKAAPPVAGCCVGMCSRGRNSGDVVENHPKWQLLCLMVWFGPWDQHR